MATAEQKRNAQIIIGVGQRLGASSRDILIALMTAFQESSLRNLSYGHLDSVGLFQQRNAWGSFSARTNPAESARMFFQGGRGGQPGLFANKNRNSMSLTAAAQWVQRSAFPNAYAKHEKAARALMGLKGTAAPNAGTSGAWVRPVRGGRITQNFGDPPPRGASYALGYKSGISIAAPHGTPVHAAADGKVVRVTSGGAYGIRVEISHGGGLWTLYAHMSSADIRQGMTVRAGAQIGRVGATGQAFGNHLHFEVRKGANLHRNVVNPLTYLNGSTTPQAYVQDSFRELNTTLEGNAMDFLSSPEQVFMDLSKPYVYVSPLSMFENSFNTSYDPLTPFLGVDAGRPQTEGNEPVTADTPEPTGTEPTGTLEEVNVRGDQG